MMRRQINDLPFCYFRFKKRHEKLFIIWTTGECNNGPTIPCYNLCYTSIFYLFNILMRWDKKDMVLSCFRKKSGKMCSCKILEFINVDKKVFSIVFRKICSFING